MVIPLRGAGKENHRTLSHLPQSTPVQSAAKARLLISWWDREVHIWQIRKPVKDLLDASDDTTPAKNHKLLGSIVIKGESSITSASISDSGDLLVVATASEIKAFQLRLLPSDEKTDLKISKVDVPKTSHGAGKVRISPDCSWVSWVEDGSRLMVAKIGISRTASDRTYAMSQPRKLGRLRRDISKFTLLGGLGAYNRSITHIAFSPDSKMIAVADLAGYIDTWVLRGTSGEDNNDARSSASSSDSSDEEREQDGEDGADGERWICNPRASLIPKLPAVAVCLSFQDRTPGASDIEVDPNDADDYTLLTITTTMQILTFNPLRGALSDWSKRNPHARIPEQFRKTRDLVKGALWQGSRVWMYGVSFLFMLDLAEDLSPEKGTALVKHGQKQGMKRKRDGTEAGAGSKMEKHSLVPQTVRVVVDAEKNEWMDVDNAEQPDDERSRATSSGFDDDEDEDTDGGELLLMRDEQGPNSGLALEKSKPAKTKWWHTYKYRPILGIVPFQSGEDSAADDDMDRGGFPPVEVALVERPIWDVDLPPRYFADGEWER